MALDGTQNPVTPVYSKPRPEINEACVAGPNSNNQDFYAPENEGKDTEIIAGDEIAVTDLSDASTDRFRIDYDPVTQLSVSLTVAPFVGGQQQPNPVLKGKTIDRVNCSWTYNQSIATQTLTQDGGLTDPSLGPIDFSYDYEAITLTADTQFTISGDTGTGILPQAQDSDSASVTFGNYLAYGADVSLIGGTAANVQTYYTNFIGLSQTLLRTSIGGTVYGLGGSNQKFFVIYPKAWGTAVFTKGIFTGGFTRLKLVLGVFKTALDGGDVEQDFTLDNGEGFLENFYIYESNFDNQADPATPFIIT